MSKTLTSDEIKNRFLKLPYRKRVSLLWEALDHMQRYNGRSRWDCVALAMGYTDSIGDGNYVSMKN